MKYLQTTALLVCLGLISLPFAGLPAIAGQNSLRQGLPGRRISGGTRTNCMAGSAPVVALSPQTNLGKTLSDSPSVFFVVPKLDTHYPLTFSLRDSDGDRVYEKSLNTKENYGVVGIQLPSQSLEMNEDYRWFFSVVCDAQDVAQNDVLSGWLRQVETDSTLNTMDDSASVIGEPALIETTLIEDRLALVDRYQEAGLWTDAISQLVSLMEAHPTDESIHDSWNQLLQTLAVEDVVSTSVATR